MEAAGLGRVSVVEEAYGTAAFEGLKDEIMRIHNYYINVHFGKGIDIRFKNLL